VAHGNPVLVANAPLRWTPRLTALAAAAEVLLAADGGANHLARIGLRPASVIGDLDSISGPTRAWLGEAAMVERPDQDRTDLDKALEYAFHDLGLGEITVLAATGGRVDHDAGNLGLLARLALGTRLVYESETHRVLAACGDLTLDSVPGETWSFWSYDPALRITVEGVRWPIEDTVIHIGGQPSISNVAVAEQIRIDVAGGSVVVMRNFEDRSV
jgi:thiamine pyrophosphokinase